MVTILHALRRCRRGASAVEYGLIVSLIVIAMVASLKLVGNQTMAMWDNIHAAMANAR